MALDAVDLDAVDLDADPEADAAAGAGVLEPDSEVLEPASVPVPPADPDAAGTVLEPERESVR